MADIRIEKNGGRARVTVGGELTVRHARALRTALIGAMQNASAVEIVLGPIERLDSAFLQMLCSANRTAGERNIVMAVIGADQERFADTLRRSGLVRRTGSSDSGGASLLTQGAPSAEQ